MEDGAFWSLIDQCRREAGDSCEAKSSWLQDRLVGLGKDAIVAFENHLLCQVSRASTFEHLAAHFIIQSYTSDDSFRDFQSWLVMQGKERFELAMADVSSIADWLERDQVESIDGSCFVTMCSSAYEAAGGDEDTFCESVDFCEPSDFLMPWPDNPSGFKTRWPKLHAKFWNQARVDALHA